MAKQRFSERMGLLPPQPVQEREVSNDLKTRLWDVLNSYHSQFTKGTHLRIGYGHSLLTHIWQEIIREPLDKKPRGSTSDVAWQAVRGWYFANNRRWFDYYDLA